MVSTASLIYVFFVVMRGIAVALRTNTMQNGETTAVRIAGLDPLELRQLHLLGSAFFDQLRQSFSQCLTGPIAVAGVNQGFETVAKFCDPTQAQFLFVSVSENS